jgi:hypothetical protein
MDRAAAVFAVTAYAVAMLDTKLPRGGGIALQPPEERALINSQISAGRGQCPAESGGVVADVLTPAQCAVVMSSFTTACPEPRGGWTSATAAQYTCSDECARIFVTAYMQCRTTYVESIASQSEETQEAVLALVGSQGSPCRVTFRQLVENRMETVAADPTCGPIYEVCMNDAECTEDLREAWGSTLVDSAETRFEAGICRKSREFLLLYECADNMPNAGNEGNVVGAYPTAGRPMSCHRHSAPASRATSASAARSLTEDGAKRQHVRTSARTLAREQSSALFTTVVLLWAEDFKRIPKTPSHCTSSSTTTPKVLAEKRLRTSLRQACRLLQVARARTNTTCA